jgi:hydroxypyruvate reductase/glycerate 2-kinase
MNNPSSSLREHARAIWQAGVDAVRPEILVPKALNDANIRPALAGAPRILVLGGGKAGAAMSAALEAALPDCLGKMEGVVNVPAEVVRPLQAIQLHAARTGRTNQPTSQGVAGARRILALAQSAGPEDVGICLLSGGGSALLPAPAPGITLEDKQQVTLLLHACGATINEMNAVRKHLSAIKGGRLAQAFSGKAFFSLIISDVIGDPLDVIASGPTAADPGTFAEALQILHRYQLDGKVPVAVLDYLQAGAAGQHPETLKTLPAHVRNIVVGNNDTALAAAQAKAEELGYAVFNLGSAIAGETREVATSMAPMIKSIAARGQPLPPPACILSGGETTVTLTDNHGLGGRNQEFVLAMAARLGIAGLQNVVVLAGGTDGEDGPTDAAGAIADVETLRNAGREGLDPGDFLDRHDAYHFFDPLGDLLRTGLTQTNVMDLRVILVGRPLSYQRNR